MSAVVETNNRTPLIDILIIYDIFLQIDLGRPGLIRIDKVKHQNKNKIFCFLKYNIKKQLRNYVVKTITIYSRQLIIK